MVKEDCLVKIDSVLYNQVKEYVNLDKIKYPSIKNFVEQAVMRALEFKRYDIEGVDTEKNRNKRLVDVVGKPSGGYALCSICNHAFFKNKNPQTNTGKINICEGCGVAIASLVGTIRDKKFKDRKAREAERKEERENEYTEK